jgi:hypothetical protein
VPTNPPAARDRTREIRVRRIAARQGYRVSKFRSYDATDVRHGRWLLTTSRGRLLISHVVDGTETGAPIEEIEKFLGVERPGEPPTSGSIEPGSPA